jgi:hypothetical protein
MGCPETKHITLRNIPEERRSPLSRGGKFMLNKPVNYLAYNMVIEWHEKISAVVIFYRVC